MHVVKESWQYFMQIVCTWCMGTESDLLLAMVDLLSRNSFILKYKQGYWNTAYAGTDTMSCITHCRVPTVHVYICMNGIANMCVNIFHLPLVHFCYKCSWQHHRHQHRPSLGYLNMDTIKKRSKKRLIIFACILISVVQGVNTGS